MEYNILHYDVLGTDTGVHHSHSYSWCYLTKSPSATQPDYVDNVCILLLLNSPKGRNSTAQDQVTMPAKEYCRGERWCAYERAPSGNALFFVWCAQWPHLIGTKCPQHQQQAHGFFLRCWSCGENWIHLSQNRVLTRDPSTVSELEMSAEGPLRDDYRVFILEKLSLWWNHIVH